MRKFKLGNDPEKLEPTAEQIARRKDFTRLSHRYDQIIKRPKKRLYRDPKLLLLLFLLGVVALLLFLEEKEKKDKHHALPKREIRKVDE